eukprot:CAMPEP_0113521498 /NCGR_PEP_ID=MMETSP0014_2-20120614/44672_1 /TAXON_ID=2857 /ORGANISM="Nitzschia sp." /LENGTH=916 /DNA_ID=CAMNT_0000419461 /DNA_START=173 /DNA_END=2923 /DNA_ORIENTATION=- /assembly_acc=CAM_ASM_000159
MTSAFPATSPSISNSHHRSVTPAMNNVRRPSPSPASKQLGAAGGPGRYIDSFSPPPIDSSNVPASPHVQAGTPTSSGLIRLTLRKPMGIVFEPMYDPNAPSIQRGVRICDLPRTGAAALSRKLEVGDELLSINDKTMSRLTFDEIMDFIIEADPEEVNLLFRRPRKEVLNARMGIKTPTGTPSGPGVKWVDDESRNKNGDSVTAGTSTGPKGGKNGEKLDSVSGEKRSSKKDRKSRRSRSAKDDDETLQSEDQDYRPSRRGRKSSGRRRKEPYETESFLDILIDTICANPDSVCRDRRGGRGRDDYYSDDDETFASRDDSTYATYESEDRVKMKRKLKQKSKGQKRQDDEESSDYEETEDDTFDDKRGSTKREKEVKRSAPPTEPKKVDHRAEKKSNGNSGKYEDDGTLETVDSAERAKALEGAMAEQTPPLGLAPNPEPVGMGQVAAVDTDDDTGNPAPIKEVEYDEDNGADVSVMESLGGPSLLIEKQRQAAAAVTAKVPVPPVPQDIMDDFGKDYPLDFGFSREQTIQNDPLRFYTFVVKGLLQEHEPEKVRLLDKLLAKYRGREDHLVQKLSVRYNKDDEAQDDGLGQARSFEDAVNQNKSSALANAAIQAARERMQNDDFEADQWPDKETKEAELGDEQPQQKKILQQQGDGPSDNDSEYSGDSIDGTSPAVIAQVSELLNYVYGKTSVPGQIDRVSTIMRAYEGREAVLLELLETKALIKANREKENAGQLPAFLRDSANAQRDVTNEMPVDGDVPPVTPMAQAAINDDISSMSGVSSPAEGQQNAVNAGVLKQISAHETAPNPSTAPSRPMNVDTSGGKSHAADGLPPSSATPASMKSPGSMRSKHSAMAPSTPTTEKGEGKKKKKGIFGGLFGGKKGKNKSKDNDRSERTASRTRGLRSPMQRRKNEV